jgi:beta-phosphoglucomutase
MIRAVAFDLDGVLFQSKELHYIALNQALFESGFDIILYKDHLHVFDGLPTKIKLKALGLNADEIERVSKLKQKITQKLIPLCVYPLQNITEVLEYLDNKGYIIVLTSNSVASTCRLVLTKMQIIQYFSAIFSNESVKNPKPDPEIYRTAISYFVDKPEELLIIEDGDAGVKSATEAGGTIFRVKSPSDITLNKIKEYL